MELFLAEMPSYSTRWCWYSNGNPLRSLHLKEYSSGYWVSLPAQIISLRWKPAVTALTPLVIPEQPKGEWFDTLADTPAVATPLETLHWLCMPNSPSLGKRTYDSDTGLASPVYGPAEYDVITGLDRPTGPTELSGSNGQDDPEDREVKKPRI